ncbi:MAG: purine phosphorylase [Gammaproteobacteria bacterium]|nr:purine phosphorylase [Gammaproteobacteria bacterium]
MAARLGVVAALPLEARWLTNNHSTGAGQAPLLQVSGPEVEQAYRAAQALLNRGATALLSWGVAGALEDSSRAGSLVLPQAVVDFNRQEWAVDPRWHSELSDCVQGKVPCVFGKLATSDKVLTNAHEKIAFGRSFGAVAVDTESAGIARAAAQARIPYLVIRAIVDRLVWKLPICVTNAVNPHGSINPSMMLGALAKRPYDLFHVLRLVMGWRAAKQSMSRVISLAGPGFLFPR